jgi:hypothetical protein
VAELNSYGAKGSRPTNWKPLGWLACFARDLLGLDTCTILDEFVGGRGSALSSTEGPNQIQQRVFQ